MRLILTLAIALLSLSASAASSGTGIYTVYPAQPGPDTPAPAGYKAAYISHYGRHGSRYLESKDFTHSVISVLRKAEAKNALTPEGKALLADIRAFDAISAGRYGQLSAVGAQEEQEIGLRMAKRFAPVFRKGGKVVCVSSTASRCIMSMTNMTTSLKGIYPDLDFSFLCGEKYQKYIIAKDFVDTSKVINDPYVGKDFNENFDFDAFMSKFLTPAVNPRSIVKDPRTFTRSLFCTAADVSCVGEGPDLFRYFTEEEARDAESNYDIYLYSNFCNSKTSGHLRLRDAAILVQDVIDRADAALAGNGVVADIRYGHDSAMMTFFSLLGFGDYDMSIYPGEVPGRWSSAERMPMGTNLQMVFYRNRKGDVLVKMLFNENEVPVPALGEGPYYSWKDMRAYLCEKVSKYSSNL